MEGVIYSSCSSNNNNNAATLWTRHLCREQHWDLITDTLTTSSPPTTTSPPFTTNSNITTNLLSLAVRTNPRVPLGVLQALATLQAHQQNNSWWTTTNPWTTGSLLHEAIQYQCTDPQVYLHCIHQFPQLLSVLDGRGRTPLHCLLQQQPFHQSPHFLRLYPQLCRALWQASCNNQQHCLLHLDADGHTPIMLLLQQVTLPDSFVLELLCCLTIPQTACFAYALTRKTPYRNLYHNNHSSAATAITNSGSIQTVTFAATPLYHAILSQRSVPILQTLLVHNNNSPSTEQRVTAYRETPLHVAVTTYSATPILALLSTPASLAAQDAWGWTPLDWLWLTILRGPPPDTWRRSVARRRQLPPHLTVQTWNGSTTTAGHDSPAMMITAVLERCQALLPGQNLARAICSVRCPQPLRRLVLQHAGGISARRGGTKGRTILHCAATQGSFWLTYRAGVYAEAVVQSVWQPSPVVDCLALLQQEQNAPAYCCALRDTAGQLPLHIAIDRKQGSDDDDDIVALVRAHPAAMDCRDGITGLYPFQQAAVGPKAQLNTIFLLLRFQPTSLFTARDV